MSNFIHVYETYDESSYEWLGSIKGTYEQTGFENGGPVFSKVNGKQMYLYIHDTGGGEYGYFVFAREVIRKSTVACGQHGRGFPYPCAARLEVAWDKSDNPTTQTAPAIAAWDQKGQEKIIGIDYQNGKWSYLEDKFNHSVRIFQLVFSRSRKSVCKPTENGKLILILFNRYFFKGQVTQVRTFQTRIILQNFVV